MIGAAVSELLQSVGGDCVEPGRIKGAPKYPAIIYAMSGEDRALNIDSTQQAAGTTQTRFDIDVLCRTYTKGETMAKALMDALQGWKGNAAGIEIGLIQLSADSVVYEDAESVWAFPFTMLVHH